MSVAPNSGTKSRTIQLTFGLDAHQLEDTLLLHNRNNDVARRALAFYLHDMQSRALHQALGFVSAVQFARQRLDMSRRSARTLIAVGRDLGDLPLIDAAFCKGKISWSKVRLLVQVATSQNEHAWLERALVISCEKLECETRGAEKGRAPRSDGKGVPSVRFSFTAKLAPLAHETLEQARKKLHDEAGGDLDDAEMLQFLAESYLRQDCTEDAKDHQSASRYQIAIAHCPSCATSHVNSEDGPIELSTKESEMIRCDATVIGERGFAAQRRRVLARDGHRCLHCHGNQNLHVHHIVYREDGGSDKQSNLATLCNHCHGLIHDDFLVLKGDAPHDLTFADRFGRAIDGIMRNSGQEVTIDATEGGPCGPPPTNVATGPRFEDLVGQDHVKSAMVIACKAAKIENRPARHVLLQGPPGLGKTTLARALATESGAPFVERMGPAITTIDDLMVAQGTVLFIDEIHGMPRSVSELFFETMDQHKICVVGATTDPNLMPKALRDRFVMKEELLDYEKTELAEIVQGAVSGAIDEDASLAIADASLGTPRRALALLASVRDLQLSRSRPIVDYALVRETLKRKRLTANGLGPRHNQALDILRQQGKPIGRTRLAFTMGLDSAVFQTTIQPDLLRLQLINITPLGLTLNHPTKQRPPQSPAWEHGPSVVKEHTPRFQINRNWGSTAILN